ncbi:hypothetical protein BKA65DRAFT_498569 [Rhexocercosporidium sp. MPI-PUGE-AT-0058]|nr:hypothetical protein BKA65DRAFT_498569 [Rhexocercosporidium sp. MPI-PUGE-AT-0058]
MLVNSIFFALTLCGSTIAGPILEERSIHPVQSLSKRESPSGMQFFNANGRSDGDPASVDNPSAGTVLEVEPGCGKITATIVESNDAECQFHLPSDGSMLPGIIYTGTPAAGFFTISVPGECAGGQLNVDRECTSCGTFGENFNGLDCFGNAGGSADRADLCVSGTTLNVC